MSETKTGTVVDVTSRQGGQTTYYTAHIEEGKDKPWKYGAGADQKIVSAKGSVIKFTPYKNDRGYWELGDWEIVQPSGGGQASHTSKGGNGSYGVGNPPPLVSNLLAHIISESIRGNAAILSAAIAKGLIKSPADMKDWQDAPAFPWKSNQFDNWARKGWIFSFMGVPSPQALKSAQISSNKLKPATEELPDMSDQDRPAVSDGYDGDDPPLETINETADASIEAFDDSDIPF